MRVLVITPTYNERENLESLSTAILEQPVGADYIVVDDGSPDGTGELGDEIARRTPRFRIVHRNRKLGLGSAYREAFQRALDERYDAVVSMDGDWSHDPSYLPALLAPLPNADLVIGSRYLNGISVVNWDLKRLILSQLANSYARIITRMPFRDCTSGFQCLTRRALEALPLGKIRTSGYSFLIEVKFHVVDAGLRGIEVPIVFTDRRSGLSKISKKEVFWSMFTPWRLRLGL